MYQNVYKYRFFRLNVELQEVTAWKQNPECSVRVMKLPNLPASRALSDEISNHTFIHFWQQISVTCEN